MKNNFKALFLIFNSFLTFGFIFNKPILSHGSNDDCSNECESYYCPENSKKELFKNKKSNN